MRRKLALACVILGFALPAYAEDVLTDSLLSEETREELNVEKPFKDEGANLALAALRADDVDLLKSALSAGEKKGPRFIDAKQRTLLHYAAAAGSSKCVDWMLSSAGGFKSVLNDVDTNGRGPLFFAAARNRTAVVEQLFKAGANAHYLDKRKDTPVSVAINSGHAEVLRILYKSTKSKELIDSLSSGVLATQIRSKHFEMARLLVEYKVPVYNSSDAFHPLQFAVIAQDTATVEAILSRKPPVDAISQLNKTALQLAVGFDNTDITALLVRAGAKTNPTPEVSASVLSIAVSNGKTSQIKRLIELGVPTEKAEGEPFAPLEVALASGNQAAVDALVAAGAKLDFAGPQAADMVARAVRMDAVTLLEQARGAGFDLTKPLVSGWNAADLAEVCAASKCVSFLATMGLKRQEGGLRLATANELDKPLKLEQVVVPNDLRPDVETFPVAQVSVEVIVDAEGRVLLPVVRKKDDDRLTFVTVDAVSKWRFQPPRSKDQPVAVRAVVPVQFPASEERGFLPGEVGVPPKRLSTVAPVYPHRLKKTGMQGRVNVEFVITREGKGTRFRAISTTDPLFVDAAIDSLKQWKWAPAMKDGKPVNCRVQQMIIFALGPED